VRSVPPPPQAVVVVADEHLCAALVAALDRMPEAPRRLHAVPTDPLSPREREVLCLLAEGLSTPEIAGRLFVTAATVKTHVARVLLKLEARDRLQAVVLALRSGLIS
jgi:DNA-binding NarL/FixJ family response regulator